MPSFWSSSSSTSTRRWGCGGAFDLTVLEERPGFLAFRASGKNATKAFSNEAGGHRWQRVPPTEKRGRVHTSTVTVAVLSEPSATEVRLNERDLEWKACRGSGAGGQHRNTTDSAVQLTHLPTGIMVRCESERSQHQNKELARGLLRARLRESKQEGRKRKRNRKRRDQIGCGARGDKRRTIALQRGQVTDHVTGKSMRAKDYLRGKLEKLA